MFKSLRELTKIAVGEYEEQDRIHWIKTHATQVTLTGAMIFWVRDVESRLINEADKPAALKGYYDIQVEQLNAAALQVGGQLPKLHRKTLVAVITGDVHNRDIVDQMVKDGCESINDFIWQMQLRYYWDLEIDDCVVRQSNAKILYGFEYQGSMSRLVITPLTDRCWMTITGGLHVKLGSAPRPRGHRQDRVDQGPRQGHRCVRRLQLLRPARLQDDGQALLGRLRSAAAGRASTSSTASTSRCSPSSHSSCSYPQALCRRSDTSLSRAQHRSSRRAASSSR